MLLFRFTLFCLPLVALAGSKHYRNKDSTKTSKPTTSSLLIFPNPLQFYDDLEKSSDAKIISIRGSSEYKEYLKTMREYLAKRAEEALEKKKSKKKVIYKAPEKRPVFHVIEETFQDDSKEVAEAESKEPNSKEPDSKEPEQYQNDENEAEAQGQDQDQENSSEEEQDDHDQPEELYPEENENEYPYQDQAENEYPYHIEDQPEDDVHVHLKTGRKPQGGWSPPPPPSPEPGFLSQLLGKIKGIVPKLHSVEFPAFQLAIAKPEEMSGWGSPDKEKPAHPDDVIHEYQFGGGMGSLSKDENGVSFTFSKGPKAPTPKPPKGKGAWGKTFLAVLD